MNETNFIVIYNLEDPSSLEFATYYAGKHGMLTSSVNPSDSINTGIVGGVQWAVDGQLVGIDCSDQEILQDEEEFNNRVMNPIRDAIDKATDLSNMEIMGIVVGYNVPGGYYDDSDVISTQSRLARINHLFSKKYKNKLYDRSVFKRFDSNDMLESLICSRIDAPSLLSAKTYVDNADLLNRQLFVSGKFYIDPYSDRQDYYAREYTESLLDFYNNNLSSLNLDTWSTTYMDPYIDSCIPYVQDDSFVWSWFSDRGTLSYFKSTTALRVFFYNADFDGAFEMRNSSSKRWPYLSMESSYIATAGAMSNPTIEGFLNPRPFFDALLRGATIGEAYLFSCPFLDWTVGLFGDPLVYCSFPSYQIVEEDVISQHNAWDEMSVALSKVSANLYKKGNEYKEILFSIVDMQSYHDYDQLVISLLSSCNKLYMTSQDSIRKSQLKNISDSLLDFPRKKYTNVGNQTKAPPINNYLVDQNFKLSRLLEDISCSGQIEDSNMYDEGWWRFDFVLQDDSAQYTNYHFILEISLDENFSNPSNIILTKDSIGISNWYYEKSKGEFFPLTSNGVPTSYVGRRIRYESRFNSVLNINEYLDRAETYYFRITQYDAETSVEYESRIYSDIIWT